MTSQALASLTATYTDSEGEENVDDDEQQEAAMESRSGSSSVSTPRKPVKTDHVVVRTKTRLVSYHDDTIASDEDNDSDDEEMSNVVIQPREQEIVADDSAIDKKYEHLGVKLPPEPPGRCPQDLQDKINRLYDKMVQEKLDMNKVIQERKDFRNPSIYEKLIQFCRINEFGTNYPPDKFDPFRFGKESYYEELSKVQMQEMSRREKERREKSKIEFVAAQAKRQEEKEAKKRNSKWDQQGPNGAAVTNIKPAGLVQPVLTKSITGNKSTVISAFGTLPNKKPRL